VLPYEVANVLRILKGMRLLAELTSAKLITRDARLARAPGIRCAVEVFS
jgi:hypothetical protein